MLGQVVAKDLTNKSSLFAFFFFADFLKSKVEIDYFGSLIERCCGMFA